MKINKNKVKKIAANVLPSAALLCGTILMNSPVYAATDFNAVVNPVKNAANDIVQLVQMIFGAILGVWAVVCFIMLALGGDQTKQRAKSMLLWCGMGGLGVMLVTSIVNWFFSILPAVSGTNVQ